MRFQILSHAGLLVEVGSRQLVFDPWLVGSTYWRSWWNYPPVPPAVVRELRPDFIYLTHIHWDHFQGVSLKRFDRSTPILVPKGHYARMRRDLSSIGFDDVRELRHGEKVQLGPDFQLTSYQFFPALDSAAVVEAEGVTLLNANDAKFMGGPLAQILRRHGSPDFVFRSHSSANGRLCYEVIDAPDEPVDDENAYIQSFFDFSKATGARYAIPFASNHCFLHRDVFTLNHTIKTPLMVEEHYRRHGGSESGLPQVQIMVSGDSWTSSSGFDISGETRAWFVEREERLEAYARKQRARLEKFYELEERSRVRLPLVQRYFDRFCAAIPRPVRWLYRQKPVTFVVSAGEREDRFLVDLWTGRVADVTDQPPASPVFEIHTSTFIFKQCLVLDLFSHLPISKRVRFRVTKTTKPLMQLLNGLWILYEYDMLPLREVMLGRFVETWSLRWRELLLYSRIVADLSLGRGFDQQRYLLGVRPPPNERAGSGRAVSR